MRLINTKKGNQQLIRLVGLTPGTRLGIYYADAIGSDRILYTEFAVGNIGDYNTAQSKIVLLKDYFRSVSPLPRDIPKKGVLRIRNPDSGAYMRFPYWSVNRASNIFFLNNAIGNITGGKDLVEGREVFIPFVEQQIVEGSEISYTIQNDGQDISVVIRARKKGYLPMQRIASASTYMLLNQQIDPIFEPLDNRS